MNFWINQKFVSWRSKMAFNLFITLQKNKRTKKLISFVLFSSEFKVILKVAFAHFYVYLKTRWILKLWFDQNLIVINYKSNDNFKSYIILEGTYQQDNNYVMTLARHVVQSMLTRYILIMFMGRGGIEEAICIRMSGLGHIETFVWTKS